VNAAGEIVWVVGEMKSIHDAERLPSGNTLITLRHLQKVVEVDATGKVVWEKTGLSSPSDADRLANGNTLVSEYQMLREFDPTGKEVARTRFEWVAEAERYEAKPPASRPRRAPRASRPAR
jgi:hypothetical protein